MSVDAALPPAVTARLAELAAAYALPAAVTPRLGALLLLLARDQHAPSAVRDPARAVEAHVADSLTALELAEVRGAHRIADLGSGAGFPGLVLAIALPDAHVALIESNTRRCEFLERARVVAEASNAETVDARVESWTEGCGACDVVTARALARLGVLLEYAAPLLEPGGALVAWKGRRDLEEERVAATAAATLGLGVTRILPVVGGRESEHRHLHIYMKVSETPLRFPRRPGRATKRPLGADSRPPADRRDAAATPPSDRKRR